MMGLMQMVGYNLFSGRSIILGGLSICYISGTWFLVMSYGVMSEGEFGLVMNPFSFWSSFLLRWWLSAVCWLGSSSSYAGGQAYLLGLSHLVPAS
jgi:hypothetical protein